MSRRNLRDLQVFVTVAREGSFTRAAAQLGVSQSALSQAIRGLEERLGLRLLTRTTRSVSVTEAGERLLATVGQRFDDIEAELDALTALRDKPAGNVRITCGENVLRSILLPRLLPLLHEFPDINIEFDVNYGLRNIVADRFDAGVRLGESVDRDMIAMPIGPPIRMAAAASPAYFAANPPPKKPTDLLAHRCITLRLPTYGGVYVWEFERRGKPVNVHTTGQLIFNTTPPMIEAALDGLGVVFVPENELTPWLQDGRLVRVLADWCPPFDGYYLYYPSRRQPSPAFSRVLEALRLR